MSIYYLDLETYLIGARLAPRTVSLCFLIEEVENPWKADPVLWGRDRLEEFIDLIEKDPSPVFIGHNISFDFGCLAVEFPRLLPLIFKAYSENRVYDTMIREKLLGIKFGNPEIRQVNLKACVKRYFKVDLGGKEGEDSFRLNYSKLDQTPIDKWPQGARDYAIADVVWTKKVFDRQKENETYFQKCNSMDQFRAAWALHLISVYGMRINPDRAKTWLEEVKLAAEKGLELAKGLGILRPNGSRNVIKLREIVSEAYQGKPPLTDKGHVKTDKDTLKNSGVFELVTYSESSFASKLASTYAPILRGGNTVHPRYNVLVKSGRTSCSKPNMQNPPRGGGFRQVFEPRPGFVYVLCDFDQIELVALGQIHLWMFKTSAIADAINEGRDLHCEVAAKLKNVHYNAFLKQYEIGYEWAKNLRHFSKLANYGFCGGLSAPIFREYARGYGLDVSEDEAKEIRAAWLATWPEMQKYFSFIGRETKWGSCDVVQFLSNRIRGGCSYTQFANTLFQGLVADGCKESLFRVAEKCFMEEKSPLYGSRPIAFLHDEIILESPEENAAGSAAELQKVMIETMERWIPDVKISASAYLSRVWSKSAGPVHGENGGLIPWEP